MSICSCTLAIHQPYRERARLLCADLGVGRHSLDWLTTPLPLQWAGLAAVLISL